MKPDPKIPRHVQRFRDNLPYDLHIVQPLPPGDGEPNGAEPSDQPPAGERDEDDADSGERRSVSRNHNPKPKGVAP